MNWYKQSLSEDNLGYKREFKDLVINVENAAGTERVGIDPDGKEWRTKMKYDYGFISAQNGVDGDALDVYVGPDEKSEKVFIVHQNNPETGKYDEDKMMIGFKDDKDAKKNYLAHYDDPDFFGSMTEMSFDEFSKIIKGKSKKAVNWKKKGKKVKASSDMVFSRIRV